MQHVSKIHLPVDYVLQYQYIYIYIYIWTNQNGTCQQDSPSVIWRYSCFEQYQHIYIYIHVLCTQVSDYIYWVLTTLVQTLLVLLLLLLCCCYPCCKLLPPGLLPHQTPSFRQELFFAWKTKALLSEII